MPKSSKLSAAVLALCVAVVLVLGSSGGATAGALTKGAVKKIAAKVVKKQAPKLSVAHAATAGSATNAANAANAANAGQLAGAAPSTYLDRAIHENLTGTTGLTAGFVT